MNDKPVVYSKGSLIEKYGGDWGGPGRVAAVAEPKPGKYRYLIAFELKGGYGELYQILSPNQVRPRSKVE